MKVDIGTSLFQMIAMLFPIFVLVAIVILVRAFLQIRNYNRQSSAALQEILKILSDKKNASE